ncbi:hypothetical protein BDW62DRAFT_206264 [Aspergillus aurantiobrunneus]
MQASVRAEPRVSDRLEELPPSTRWSNKCRSCLQTWRATAACGIAIGSINRWELYEQSISITTLVSEQRWQFPVHSSSQSSGWEMASDGDDVRKVQQHDDGILRHRGFEHLLRSPVLNMSTSSPAASTKSPGCLLCADDFSTDKGTPRSNPCGPRVFDERLKWRDCLSRQGYVEESPANLASVYFSIPWHWKAFSRAILSKRGRCRLSGVGIPGTYFLLPKAQPDCVMVGDLPSTGKKTTGLDEMWQVEMKVGDPGSRTSFYLMHERCWTLANRVLGARRIEENLGVFLDAALGAGAWTATNLSNLEGKYNDEVEWAKHGDSKDRDLELGDMVAHINRYSQHWRCDEDMFALRDPLKVVDVWTGIEAEQAKYRGESQMDRAVMRPAHDRRRSSRLHRGLNMPAELIMDIVDLLPACQEVRELMWAFPYWAVKLPYSYWRKRFIREFMLEDEQKQIPDSASLNWRRLYYRTDSIHRSSHGLRNRQRIVSILEQVNVAFIERLNKGK